MRGGLGGKGELRAVGNVLRDQWAFMARCGFDAFEVANDDAEEVWTEAMGEISVAYQPATDRRPWAAALRRPRAV